MNGIGGEGTSMRGPPGNVASILTSYRSEKKYEKIGCLHRRSLQG